MFTGIIEEIGIIESITQQARGVRLQISAKLVLSDAKIGDSISVNGCCLTIVDKTDHSLYFDCVEETMLKSNFKNLSKSSSVNLERALKVNDRLGGHLVQGHVDGTGNIESVLCMQDGSFWVTISAPHLILRYLILKGSITVDGVSLTIAELTDQTFSFAMIPHTSLVTTLGKMNVNNQVNIEVDMMAKYIERLILPLNILSKAECIK